MIRLALLLALAPLSASAQSGTMAPDALTTFIEGRAYAGVNPETGAEVARVVYAPDGSSVLSFADGRREAGAWRIEADFYCTRYAAFRDGSENCFRVEPLDGGAAQAWYVDGRKALILRPID